MKKSAKPNPPIENVHKLVATHYGLTVEQLTMRGQKHAEARYVAVKILRTLTDHTLEKIGKSLGNRTTFAMAMAMRHINSDERLNGIAEQLMQKASADLTQPVITNKLGVQSVVSGSTFIATQSDLAPLEQIAKHIASIKGIRYEYLCDPINHSDGSTKEGRDTFIYVASLLNYSEQKIAQFFKDNGMSDKHALPLVKQTKKTVGARTLRDTPYRLQMATYRLELAGCKHCEPEAPKGLMHAAADPATLEG